MAKYLPSDSKTPLAYPIHYYTHRNTILPPKHIIKTNKKSITDQHRLFILLIQDLYTRNPIASYYPYFPVITYPYHFYLVTQPYRPLQPNFAKCAQQNLSISHLFSSPNVTS